MWWTGAASDAGFEIILSLRRPRYRRRYPPHATEIMTAADIAEIEEALGFILPDSYRAVVLNYPEALAETEAPDFGLFDTPTAVIDTNLEVRRNGYFGEPWPDQYVIIGENGCGDYYVITKNATEFTVGFSDHEAMECNLFASNLDDFIAKLLSEMDVG